MEGMRYRFYFLMTFLFGIFSCSDSQTNRITYPEYYKSTTKIFKLMEDGDLDIGILKFDSLIEKIPFVPSSDYFKMAKFCAEKGRCDRALKYLELSFLNGHEYDHSISPLNETSSCRLKVKDLISKESSIHQKYFNFEYKAIIDSMFSVDQNAREGKVNDIGDIDSLNFIALLYLIDKFGFPSEYLIGSTSAFNAYILMLHMDKDLDNIKLKPILDNAFDEGYIGPIGYAWIVDRRRIWGPKKIEPYYYHMRSEYYDNLSKNEIIEINRRRDSIGLDSM
jgi:hypothetical protein